MEYPMRINKYLAHNGICSRREADALISEGKVMINGRKAELGAKVEEGDEVEVSDKRKKLVYYAFYKPKEIITHSPQGDEKSIEDIAKFPEKVFPLGRLDKSASGLILLTNDGRVTDKLLSPDYDHEKEYEVKVNKLIDEKFLRRMSKGIKLEDGYITKKCVVKKKGPNFFSIILTEGKKHQIRRMCAALGYNVEDLKRIRVVNIKLANLEIGHSRKIKGKELIEFLSNIGLKV